MGTSCACNFRSIKEYQGSQAHITAGAERHQSAHTCGSYHLQAFWGVAAGQQLEWDIKWQIRSMRILPKTPGTEANAKTSSSQLKSANGVWGSIKTDLTSLHHFNVTNFVSARVNIHHALDASRKNVTIFRPLLDSLLFHAPQVRHVHQTKL